ncbi:MAG: universal stress protein UspA, partial [Caulobacteraceae bacterium]|nr:universal stress protein UspA [Caulobacteraceae bacterium]
MSYAAILVHVEAQPINHKRLALAADLARRFDAALIGVGAEIYEPPADGAGYLDGQVLVVEANMVKEDLQRAEAAFTEVARTVGVESEWSFAVSVPADIVIERSESADLIVIGPRSGQPWGLHTRANPGDVLMGAGRPVLVTPPDLARLDASRIVVAWKNTRETRRAVTDALPLLKRADQVTIAQIRGHDDDTAASVRPAGLIDYLRRHGVEAGVTSRVRGKATVAEALL